jgi:hypothetical protein
MNDFSSRPGIPLRALAPNAITALALCTGLSGAWFAMQGRWENAVAAMVITTSVSRYFISLNSLYRNIHLPFL